MPVTLYSNAVDLPFTHLPTALSLHPPLTGPVEFGLVLAALTKTENSTAPRETAAAESSAIDSVGPSSYIGAVCSASWTC
ncbi:hypothetical protein KY285_002964 [Solanum tuberosum]|nr:hypothetical protein KY285_002964 [Solanum tuberosum]